MTPTIFRSVEVHIGMSNLPRCARCGHTTETFSIRGELLCAICFKKYVHTKVVKRLEANKIRGGYNETAKSILVPISTGVSSLSLVHILNTQLQERSNNSKHPGYSLHLLFVVDKSSLCDETHPESIVTALKEIYPSQELSVTLLQECFEYGVALDGIDSCDEISSSRSLDSVHRLNNLFASAEDLSYRNEMEENIRGRLIDAFALRKGIDTVFFGDTTTRLAERALTETARGRGKNIPQLITDSKTDSGLVHIFPLRDLLRKEVELYTSLTGSRLKALLDVSTPSVATPSSRNLSIDGLMQHYIENVEDNYPSIVANVVRTTSKLKAQEH